MSGSLPAGVDPDAFTDWMTQLRAVPVHHFRQQPRSAGRRAEGFAVAGQTEPPRAGNWAGRPLPTLADVVEAHALREQGIAHVVISLGAEGALWVNASGARIAKTAVRDWHRGRRRSDGRRPDLRPAMRESSEHTLRLATAAALAVARQRRRDRSSPVGRDDARRSETFNHSRRQNETLLMVDSSPGAARGHPGMLRGCRGQTGLTLVERCRTPNWR
ncbi:hypothetical protein J4732_20055 [Serratia marcescens]|uniref:Carbohydrate kinase PfkB domain-containing protein n=1 Tax=Serratia marcescens TaxID=615 RepID=A0A939NKP8_SERMA|nr:hypothetical protein [Serratia marcescens]